MTVEPLLAVSFDGEDARPVITLTGEVDDSTRPNLELALRSVLPVSTVTIDCAGVTFMDSGGFMALVAACEASPMTRFELRDPSEQVARLVDLLGVGELLGVPASA